MQTVFESKPRWPGAPPHCLAANLPAFDDRVAVGAYKDRYCPGVSITDIWLCEACGKWHFKGVGPFPSGMSSGKTQRDIDLPMEVRASISRSAPRQLREALARMGRRSPIGTTEQPALKSQVKKDDKQKKGLL